MTDSQHPDQIVTPEAVSVTVDVAGIGSRMIAAFIDSLIQAAMVFVFVLVFVQGDSVAGFAGGAGIAVLVIALFLIGWGYYPLFEGLSGGRTPGKRAQKLRVMRADGQPAGLAPIIVRNLLRIVDFLPMYYGIGTIAMLVTKKSQRLGDLAAGTVVVRERPPPVPSVMPGVSSGAAAMAAKLDTAALRERDYDVARSFLQRRPTLDPAARRELAGKIATALRARVPEIASEQQSDEQFIEAAVRAYRDRFAGEQPGSRPPPYGP